MTFNHYCDESCYLEYDTNSFMVLGMISCPKLHYNDVKNKFKRIYYKHNVPENFEIKSTKISKGKYNFYSDIVNLFISDNDLFFRCIVADKTNLQHQRFNQNHDDWYYKMYYRLIENSHIDSQNNVYIDYKDRYSYIKGKKVESYLNRHFLSEEKHFRIQTTDSKETRLLQLSDLFIGLVAYKNKDFTTSIAKLSLIDIIEQEYHIDVSETNYNSKFNVFHWTGENSRRIL